MIHNTENSKMKYLMFIIIMFFVESNIGFAQNESTPIKGIQRQILNSNQGMSLEEIQRFYTKSFNELDLNNNQQIDFEEYTQIDSLKLMKSKMPQGAEYEEIFQTVLKQSMQQWDQDKDGEISLNEYLTLGMSFANRLDTNGDQIISVEEVKVDMEKRQKLGKEFEKSFESVEKDMESLENNINKLDGLKEDLESIEKITNEIIESFEK